MPDFDEWYASARPRLYPPLVAWCGDPGLAADALDEAFVRALERWSRVSGLSSPEGWLWRTATNVARRRARRSAREGAHVRAERSEAQAAPELVLDVDLLDALRSLTNRQRTALVLRFVADLPEATVAEMMGVAPGTVGATVHQARRRLAPLLEGDPAAPLPSAPRIDGALP